MRGKDIKKYSYIFDEKYLISTFPSLKIDIEKYPAVKEYLLSFGFDRLNQSGKLNARKKTHNKWFETQDSISYWEDFNTNKIIWAEMTNVNAFVWDSENIMTNQTCYFIPNASKYLLGILNSKITYFYFSKIATGLGEGAFRWIKQFIELIPIPKITQEKQKLFIDLVNEILEKKTNNQDTKTLENEIDELVCKLYELTDDEINIIKEATKTIK